MATQGKQIIPNMGGQAFSNFAETSVEIAGTTGTLPIDARAATQHVFANALTGATTVDITNFPLDGQWVSGVVEFAGGVAAQAITITTSVVGWTIEGPTAAAPSFAGRGSFTYRTVPTGSSTGYIAIIDSGQDFLVIP